ncbi:MAG: hypothetical protein LBS18_04670, partial [Clostridiales bacterium]|nr:hypothetical protein [Clostridiales bacterium]
MPIKAKNDHLDVLFRWVRYSSKFNLSELLQKHNINRIAIYGGGALGVALYENLALSIKVEYIIDHDPDLSFPYDVKTIVPGETTLLNDLDAVIITVDFYTVEERLRPHVKCVSLGDLIIDIDEYSLFEEVVQHVYTSNAKLLLADLTAPLYHIKNPSLFEKIRKNGGKSWIDLYHSEEL